MFSWIKGLFKPKKVEANEILHKLAIYCSGAPDLDTLNKIVETNSLTIMKRRGRLKPKQIKKLDTALKTWSKGNSTPKEFKEQFRGGK